MLELVRFMHTVFGLVLIFLKDARCSQFRCLKSFHGTRTSVSASSQAGNPKPINQRTRSLPLTPETFCSLTRSFSRLFLIRFLDPDSNRFYLYLRQRFGRVQFSHCAIPEPSQPVETPTQQAG